MRSFSDRWVSYNFNTLYDFLYNYFEVDTDEIFLCTYMNALVLINEWNYW